MGYFNGYLGKHTSQPDWEYSPEAYKKNSELFKRLTTSEVANNFMSMIKKYFSNVSIFSSKMEYSQHIIEFSARYYPEKLGQIMGKKIYFPIRIFAKVENCSNPEPYRDDVQFRTCLEFYVYCLEKKNSNYDSYKNMMALQNMTKYFDWRGKAIDINFDNWSSPTYIKNPPSKNRCAIIQSLFDLYQDSFYGGNLLEIECIYYKALLGRIDSNEEGIRDNLVSAIKTGASYWLEK